MQAQRHVQLRVDRIVRWIQQQVAAAGAAGGVVGMSGGIDSSVVASLCHRALGGQALGLILPCHSLHQDVEDARRVARGIGIRTEELDLAGIYDGLISLLPPAGELPRANLKPRLRMLTLYYYANGRNLVVVGTSNGAELVVG